jgi:Ni,Fe-hydrogenase III small subunit
MVTGRTVGKEQAPRGRYAIRPEQHAAELKAALLNDIRRSVYVYRIDCGGCNGCEIEIFAALTPLFDVERFGIKVVSSPRHADVLLYTGSMTRSMRLPALRAYHAAPDPKICVAYGACGCSGGVFHDLYCVWGGADTLIPIDVYIPGCPPTPAATIYGFAMALGMLGQKLKASHHIEGEEERVQPWHPQVPLAIRVAVEREARRMAGYLYGRRIANQFLEMFESDPKGVEPTVRAYLEKQEDPRLAEIVGRLLQVAQAHAGAS